MTKIEESDFTKTSWVLSPDPKMKIQRFHISTDDYNAIEVAAVRESFPAVTGSVVRGFLGVPIAVRLDPIAAASP